MCGYLAWHLNIDYLELDDFTKKVQSEFGTGLQLPVSSSIAPVSKPTQSSTQPRLSPSYNPHLASDPSSPATLITTVGDEEEDEEVESPSNSTTSSPASSAVQTPPSNADIDGRNEAGVIISGVGVGMVGSGVFGVEAGSCGERERCGEDQGVAEPGSVDVCERGEVVGPCPRTLFVFIALGGVYDSLSLSTSLALSPRLPHRFPRL